MKFLAFLTLCYIPSIASAIQLSVSPESFESFPRTSFGTVIIAGGDFASEINGNTGTTLSINGSSARLTASTECPDTDTWVLRAKIETTALNGLALSVSFNGEGYIQLNSSTYTKLKCGNSDINNIPIVYRLNNFDISHGRSLEWTVRYEVETL